MDNRGTKSAAMRNTNAPIDGSGESGQARSDADDLAWFVLASTIDTLHDLLREERARCCRRSCCHTHDEDQPGWTCGAPRSPAVADLEGTTWWVNVRERIADDLDAPER